MNRFLNKKIFFLTLFLLLLPIQFAMGIYIYFSPQLPSTDDVRKVELQVPLKIFTSDGKLIGEYGEIHRTKLTFEEIPEDLVNAFLAAEDSGFFSNTGVDFFSLIRATYEYVREGRIVSGGGTITMQVARNYVLSKEQTFERKIKEIFMALKLNLSFSKEEIFELYVNQIFLGNRAYGIAAASEIYYGKKLSELSLAQKAMIASLPKAPSRINPIANPRRALIRRNWVLTRMEDLNYIDSISFENSIKEPITATFKGVSSEIEADYLAEEIRKYMISRFGLAAYKEGYEVYSTINSKNQLAANKALKEGIENYEVRHGYKKPNNFVDLLPENFIQRSDLFYIISYDPENFKDDFGIAIDLKNPFDEALDFLADNPNYNDFSPHIVLSSGVKKISLLSKSGNIETINFLQLNNKIRPRIDANKKGKFLTEFSSFFEPGDLIWVKDEGDSSYEFGIHPDVQAALVSLDPNTGKILSMVGGYNFQASKFNRVTQAKPQLGSNFKPFLYAAAFENDFTPASLINDAPIVFEDANLEDYWRPKNSSGRFYGPTRLREALLQSRNVVSIRLLQDLGLNRTKNYLTRFGFEKDELPNDLSLALGSYGLSPLENASYFAVFANGGRSIQPFFINKILKSEEEIEFLDKKEISENLIESWVGKKFSKKESFTIDPRVSYIINDILLEATRRGTGKKIQSLNRDDFAGKTGTTNDAESTWFTGFNKNILTTVWFGYDQPASLGNNEFGSSTALPIWLNYMEEIIDDIEYGIQPRPSGLIAKKINLNDGMPANPEDSKTMFELFLD